MNHPLQVRTDFAEAQIDTDVASLNVTSPHGELISIEFNQKADDLHARIMYDSRELYDDKAEELAGAFELYFAVSGLKGNAGVIGALKTQSGHPDVDLLLHYLDA